MEPNSQAVPQPTSSPNERDFIEDVLTQSNVEHRFVHHAAVTSVQESLERGVPAQLGIPLDNVIKNLLVRDSQHRLFLLVASRMRNVNLRRLAQSLGTSHLSMARLDEAHGLFGKHKGSVSLFDLLKQTSATNEAENLDISIVVDEGIRNISGEIAFAAGSDTESVLFPASEISRVAEAVGARTHHTVNSLAFV